MCLVNPAQSSLVSTPRSAVRSGIYPAKQVERAFEKNL